MISPAALPGHQGFIADILGTMAPAAQVVWYHDGSSGLLRRATITLKQENNFITGQLH